MVWLRMDSIRTHKRIQSSMKRNHSVVAMYPSKVECNREYCIGPGIDNSVSWYVICEALESLYTSKLPFSDCFIQLSVREEVSETVPLFTKDELKGMDHYLCIDTDVAEVKQLYPSRGLSLYTDHPKTSGIFQWFSKQSFTQIPPADSVGGTNLDLYKRDIPSHALIGIPLIGMHSAYEQVETKMIRGAIRLLRKCLKLKTRIEP